jgi:hypothetical protein
VTAAAGSSDRPHYAGDRCAHSRTTIIDPERSSADAVHEFRRSMKQWRGLMRLLEPFVCPKFLGF